LIDQDSFDRALRFITSLQEKGELVVGLKPPFAVTFEVREEVLTPALADAGLTQDSFEEASGDIGEMVLAMLRDAKDSYVRSETREVKEEERAEAEKVLGQRLEQATSLIDDRLRARYQLKVSSKAPAFASIDWDVKMKTFDARLGPLQLPYATLKIRWQREFEMEAESFFGRNIFDSVQINFAREEVEYLMHELEVVRRRLEADEKGTGQ